MTTAFILALIAALGFATCFFFVLNYARKKEKELTWTRQKWHEEVQKNEHN